MWHRFLRVARPGYERSVDYVYAVALFMRSVLHARRLNLARDRTNLLSPGDIILLTALRDQSHRVPVFLRYYRRLGVRHFLFVDCGSTDGLLALVDEEEDVSVWRGEDARHSTDWLNWLLLLYGHERWCVVCDIDEFLVFPYCDKRRLEELAIFLDSERRRSLFSIRLEMYGYPSSSETVSQPLANPLDASPFFDWTGYTQSVWPGWAIVRGGVRRRASYRDAPESAPVLSRYPLVRWRRGYGYFPSRCRLVPPKLNDAHAVHYGHVAPTGCLCAFPYADCETLGSSVNLMHAGSRRYWGWESLVAAGVMSQGQWF